MIDLKTFRKENGFCCYCGKELDRKGIHCINCNDQYNKWKNERIKILHVNNFCTTCGNKLDREGWFCTTCANKLKLRARIRCAERRLMSLCVQCGVHVDEGSYCQRCLQMRRDRYYRKKEEG